MLQKVSARFNLSKGSTTLTRPFLRRSAALAEVGRSRRISLAERVSTRPTPPPQGVELTFLVVGDRQVPRREAVRSTCRNANEAGREAVRDLLARAVHRRLRNGVIPRRAGERESDDSAIRGGDVGRHELEGAARRIRTLSDHDLDPAIRLSLVETVQVTHTVT